MELRGRRGWLAVSLGVVTVALMAMVPASRQVAGSLLGALSGERSAQEYDVVIYGGSFSGYAAARMIQRQGPGLRVLVIVPQRQLGEIGTVGAMNFWDLKGYERGWIAGTFKELFERFDRAYDPDDMAGFMADRLSFDPNIEVRTSTDIVGVGVRGREIVSLDLQTLSNLPGGRREFDQDTRPQKVRARIFLDASFNGRMLRLAGFTGITGREDYSDRRQQAVTLMFEIEGLDFWKAVSSGDFYSNVDKDRSRMLWGGDPAKHPKTHTYNRRIQEIGRLKPLNLAEGALGRYWVNVILLYGVDATKEDRDAGTERMPASDLMSLDEGYTKLRSMVESDEFLEALRDFPGFENVHITRFAPMLYVRESIHSSNAPGPTLADFAIRAEHVSRAGLTADTGEDKEHYARRVGLQFYFLDTQGYLDDDPLEKVMEAPLRDIPEGPCYAPYDAIRNPKFDNVLVCGYGINASSIAWFALRVLPNQMVLGDAAGTACVEAFETGTLPGRLSDEQVASVRRRLVQYGGIVDKPRKPAR